jgi:heme/copper-type cytochrome/quinol oxidase subunit 3
MALSDHLRFKDWTYSATSRAAQRRNEIALNVLIGSLAMFFAAALIGYLILRYGYDKVLPPVRLPAILWVSTALALASSVLLRRSLRSIRQERSTLFRRQLLAAFVLGAGFCLTQSIGLSAVFRDHLAAMRDRPQPPPAVEAHRLTSRVMPQQAVPGRGGVPASFPVRTPPPRGELRLEGLFFVLILLHALHFVAGMTALTVVTRRGLAGRYDHEYHAGVKLCATYWRFLDVVWVALFGTLLLTT